MLLQLLVWHIDLLLSTEATVAYIYVSLGLKVLHALLDVGDKCPSGHQVGVNVTTVYLTFMGECEGRVVKAYNVSGLYFSTYGCW